MNRANGRASDIPPGSQWLLYTRDSGHEQQAASCDQQISFAKQLLADSNAVLAREPYVDRARKGSSMVGRAELDRLLAEAQPGVATGVMFWSSNRMAREVNGAQLIRSTLRSRGYALYFISDNVPNIGKWTPLLEVVKDIANQEFLEQLSKDVKRGLADVLAAGGIPANKPPRGYKREPFVYRIDRDGRERTAARWVKDPARRDAVRLAWEMRLAGYSYRAINEATHLFRASGLLTRTFSNPIYKGELHYGGRVYPNHVEPYVTEDEWDVVQRVGAERRAAHPRTLGNKRLLTGLIYCGICGARMMGKNGHARRRKADGSPIEYWNYYYACFSYARTNEYCGARYVEAMSLEARVLEAVDRTYLDKAELERQYAQWETALNPTSEREHEVGELRGEIVDLERRISRLLDELESGASVGPRLAQRETELAEKRAKLAELESLPVPRLSPMADLLAISQTIRAAVERGDRETARLYLSKVVLRIEAQTGQAPRITLRPPIVT